MLEIKDIDIRLSNLLQCRYAVDQAIHIGGASSATIPMVSLFYGGIIDINVENPTATDQDQFVLSKGHAVATLASIYADLGYFGQEILKNSRSVDSILNGHPGPLLPGVHVATGPMGQGLGVAQGFAIYGQKSPKFDVYTVTGDGELQEGSIWESVMYAGFKKLENFCVLVDQNGGQLDSVQNLHYPYYGLGASFASFGWRVLEVDATQYHAVHHALSEFKYGKRVGMPTVIICKSTKGHGGYSDFMNNHKSNINPALLDQESALLTQSQEIKKKEFLKFFNALLSNDELFNVAALLMKHAASMGYQIEVSDVTAHKVQNVPTKVKTKNAFFRNKKITYEASDLPQLEMGQSYASHKVIEGAMKIMAKDEKIYSIDADLASTSGLQSGIGFVDKTRALNAGVAEANMMLIGEAMGILGSNVWISTFCPFFDWKVLRRIAVGHQERLEVINSGEGWLSEGHGIDLTLLATAADLETQSNGATHMGNDDVLMINEAAHVKIINISCPQQLLAVMKWIAEGNKGLVYLRILRAPSVVLYQSDFQFSFGKAFSFNDHKDNHAYVVSSGRGVYEALEASDNLRVGGIGLTVIDMPSIDEEIILEIYQTKKPIFIAEQNNGYIWNNFRKVLFSKVENIQTCRLYPMNLSNKGEINYIHSGTYKELAKHYELDAISLEKRISETLKLKK